MTILVGIREGTNDGSQTLWVCTTCRWSELSDVQPRCPNCRKLLVRATK